MERKVRPVVTANTGPGFFSSIFLRQIGAPDQLGDDLMIVVCDAKRLRKLPADFPAAAAKFTTNCNDSTHNDTSLGRQMMIASSS